MNRPPYCGSAQFSGTLKTLSSPEARDSPADSAENAPTPAALPSVTHLQFLVLDLFRSTDVVVPAQQLMAVLQSLGVGTEGPKFYQLTKRMEQCGLIAAEKRRVDVAGGHVQRTFYRLKPSGVAAWRATAAFYETRRKLKAVFRAVDSE